MKDFLEQNKKPFEVLGKIIKKVDTVRGEHKYSEETRRLAIELVESWIQEMFELSYPVKIEKEDEDDIYIDLDKELRLGRDEG
jgi:hypothetical protein